MPPELIQILVDLAVALSPILMSLASFAAYMAAAWLKQKVKHDRAGQAIDMAQFAVIDIVAAGGSAFRAKLAAAAEDGVITKAEMIEVRDAALKAAKAQAGTEVLDALKAITADPDAWLWTKIQAEAQTAQPVIVAADDVILQ